MARARIATLLITLLGLALACAGDAAPPSEAVDTASKAASEAASEAAAAVQISFGNGEANWIVTDGATRDGATFTVPEVQSDGDGWLVMHPFKDGKPFGGVYVGASFIKDGINRSVAITVEDEPDPGTMFLVMLHSDVNKNQEFDFVFVDERNVLDKAVFEGSKMIAHAIAAP